MEFALVNTETGEVEKEFTVPFGPHYVEKIEGLPESLAFAASQGNSVSLQAEWDTTGGATERQGGRVPKRRQEAADRYEAAENRLREAVYGSARTREDVVELLQQARDEALAAWAQEYGAWEKRTGGR